MMTYVSVFHAVKDMKEDPRSEEKMRALDNALYNYRDATAFAARLPVHQRPLAKVAFLMARLAVDLWREGEVCMPPLVLAFAAVKQIEKPAKFPKSKKRDGGGADTVDLKKKAYGDE